MEEQVTPDAIMELGLGFFGSKTLLTAVELGVFTELAERGSATVDELVEALDLDGRRARDFFDALVALEMLEREEGQYRNTPATEKFLDRNKESYLGGMLEMSNERLYRFWDDLGEALETGEPQNEIEGDQHPFEAIYADDERLASFLGAMTGLSGGVAPALAENFSWSDYSSVCDFGCAEGVVPMALARAHDHLDVRGFDLPKVEEHFEQMADKQGLSDRVEFHAGDFFEDELPEVDVGILGHILHDWGLEDKKTILERVHDALSEDGALIVYGSLIADDRRDPFGLLMSLNMLIETPEGFDYTPSQLGEWLDEVGFSDYHTAELPGEAKMVVAEK